MEWMQSHLGLAVLIPEGAVRLCLAGRVIMRRTPVPYTLVWLVLLIFVPFLSLGLYLLIGEPRLGTRRIKRYETLTRSIEEQAVALWRNQHIAWTSDEHDYAGLSRLGTSLTGLPTLRGNHLDLVADSQEFVHRLCADIDSARDHCHLLYYIWEPDAKGTLVANAVIRAAKRGVRCRVLVDSAGSRAFVRSGLWGRMEKAGIGMVEALPVHPLRWVLARIDLRNHRKITIIDGRIGYCGSQNITQENFRKRRGSRVGPWIDATVRVEGPAAHALQITFLRDWALDSDEKLPELESLLGKVVNDGPSVVHVVPSGPGPRPDAIHQAFLAMLYAAHEEILITTPYFVPDEATKGALQNAAMRGVDVTIVVPEISDSILVAAAARSHFEDLMDAGVKIRLHHKGLLHSKTATIDRRLSVIGSANFDMRSFWLNFEATLFIYDRDFNGLARFLQVSYLKESSPVALAAWRKRPFGQRFLDNCAQLLGPML